MPKFVKKKKASSYVIDLEQWGIIRQETRRLSEVPLSNVLKSLQQKQPCFTWICKEDRDISSLYISPFHVSSFSPFLPKLIAVKMPICWCWTVWFISESTAVIGPSGTEGLSSVGIHQPKQLLFSLWGITQEQGLDPDVGQFLPQSSANP